MSTDVVTSESGTKAPESDQECLETDGSVMGPCAKTGDPICHCGDSGNTEGHDGHGAGHNPHEEGTGKHAEHSAVFDLVAHVDATHVAVSDGSWFDPATWANGVVPGDDAKVLITEGLHVTYDGVSDARLFTVRVDGHLDFATDQDSKMVVDTMVVDGVGRLTIGTEADPVEAGVNVDIVIANNGAIDVTWDPQLLSRGIVSHGAVEMHGQEKTTHLKVATDPMAGDTSLTLSDAPDGWQVGDTLVLAGTRYDGYKWDNDVRAIVHQEPEDEILTITAIEGNQVFFDTPLQHDHDAPREDLKTSVANYSRNITIATEDPDTAAVHERGHVMFMHNDDVDVRYAEFHELGRTDKSEPALNASEFEEITPDANVKGRYSFHFHRTGTEDEENPAIALGNAVFGSPGWGFVHHDSHAVLHDNASYNTFGAGFVAESGNETGSWTDNIAIYAQGVGKGNPKIYIDVKTFDTGRSGDGFWFQSRLVDASGNIAASVNNGFAYVHRGATGDSAQLTFDASAFDLPDALSFDPSNRPDDAPILNFHDNETFASHQGLIVVKANPNQGHDIHSHLKDFTAWSVEKGAHVEYTSHYLLEGFDLVGRESAPLSVAEMGISTGTSTSDITIIDARIDGFKTGIHASKNFLSGFDGDMGIAIVDPLITNTDTPLDNINVGTELIQNVVSGRFEIELDGPLTWTDNSSAPGGRDVRISGTKTDSIGEIAIPAGIDNYDVKFNNVLRILEENGYYEDATGNRYFVLEAYYSDRMTGEVFKFGHLVEIAPTVQLGNPHNAYGKAELKGLIDFDSAAPVTESEQAETGVGAELVIDLLANDQDPDSDTLAVDGILQPLNGSVFDNGDGTVTYRPNFDFTGTDSFKYWVTDGQGNFTPATATIQVGGGPETDPGQPEDRAAIDAGNNPFDAGSLDTSAQGLFIEALNRGTETGAELNLSGGPEMHGQAYMVTARDDRPEYADIHNFGLETALEQADIVYNAVQITGSDNADYINGRNADETFLGMGGDDLIRSAGGNDTVDGGSGDDILDGGDGSDDLKGGNGNDTLIAGSAGTTSQTLAGQDGDDTYILSSQSGTVILNATAETLNSGANDIIRFEDLNPTDLSAQYEQGPETTWLILSWDSNGITGQVHIAHEGEFIEKFQFADGAVMNTGQVITIAMEAATLPPTVVQPEQMVLRGDAGSNTLIGGDGDDLLDGKGGADTIAGGNGDDRIFVDHVGDVIVETEGGGYEWVSTSVSRTLETNVEAAKALGSGDINLTGNALANWLNGNAGVNVLRGGDGNDRLNGMDGDDFLDGGGGADLLEGGDGNDRIRIDHMHDRIIEHTDGGYDWVDTSVSRKLEENVESVNAIGTSAVNLTGNALANWLNGNTAGNVLEGGDGNDRLNGMDGDDVLKGGTGNDLLNGGTGADIFFFEAGDGTDVIRDFEANVDQITFGAGVTLEDLSIRQAGENTNIQYIGGLIVVTGVTDLETLDIDFQS